MARMTTPEGHPADAGSWSERAGTPPRSRGPVRAFRLVRVGLCFLYFGLGVWLTGATLLPLLRLRARWLGLAPELGLRHVQRAVHLFCRSFVGCITRVMRVAEVEWVGAEALSRGPVLVVANHPSLIDTPLLLSRMPQADFIVSPDWLRLGWLRGTIECRRLHAQRGRRRGRGRGGRTAAGGALRRRVPGRRAHAA